VVCFFLGVAYDLDEFSFEVIPWRAAARHLTFWVAESISIHFAGCSVYRMCVSIVMLKVTSIDWIDYFQKLFVDIISSVNHNVSVAPRVLPCERLRSLSTLHSKMPKQ
jgi:hypothetical protein